MDWLKIYWVQLPIDWDIWELRSVWPRKKHPTGLFIQRDHVVGKNQKKKVSQNFKENYIFQTESLLDPTQLTNLQLSFIHIGTTQYYSFCYNPRVRFWSSRPFSLFWKKVFKWFQCKNVK